MSDDHLMTQEDKDELMRLDSELATQLQQEFDEENLMDADGGNSSGIFGHPPSPIEQRLSSLSDNTPGAEFGEQISEQLLKRIGKSASPKSPHLPGLSQSRLTGENISSNDQPSTSSSSYQQEFLSDEEMARRLQAEFDAEVSFDVPNWLKTDNWDSVMEWNKKNEKEEDVMLTQALQASLTDMPCSSKSSSEEADDRSSNVDKKNA